MNAMIRFSLICIAWIVAGIGVVWAFRDAGLDELSTHGIVALGLGVTMTVGLSVALMALIFYSSRIDGSDSAEPH